MKLRYETGVATLIQFVTMTLLNILILFVSIVSGCRDGLGECVVNSFTSVVFFVLLAVWFGFVWILGFAAQSKRSKRLAQILIGAEVLIGMVALFNARHHVDILGLLTSLIDLALAIWVIYLAWRLIRAGEGRVMKSTRQRKHVGNFDVSDKNS